MRSAKALLVWNDVARVLEHIPHRTLDLGDSFEGAVLRPHIPDHLYRLVPLSPPRPEVLQSTQRIDSPLERRALVARDPHLEDVCPIYPLDWYPIPITLVFDVTMGFIEHHPVT